MPNITLRRLVAVLLFPALLLTGAAPATADDRASLPIVGGVLDGVGGLVGGVLDALGLDLEATAWDQEGTNAELRHIAQAVNADDLHRRGLTGAGVGIALIDTGVADVPGLEDVVRGPDLSLDSQFEEAYTRDLYGHGTHLAGIVASDRPDVPGLAPDATLLSVKVGAANGAVDVSQTIAAIDWVVQHRDQHNIRVLALAYGTDGTQDPRHDPLSHAVEVAWRHGIVVLVAAGNHGASHDALVNPATNPNVIAVGAIDTQGSGTRSDDEIPEFSAPGTRSRRPDVFAPGVGVVSLQAPGGHLDTHYPAARQDDGRFRGNGTSQATMVVASAAAMLLQDRPDLTPDEVKNVLERGSQSLNGLFSGQGLIDVEASRRLTPRRATQRFAPSIGDGSLEAARGSAHLGVDGEWLDDERDIHGQPFDSAAWAQRASAGTSWDDGRWNGAQWTDPEWADGRWTGPTWLGWSWNGWSWNGWSWNGWSWNGWSWNGWSWHAEAWE